MQLYNEQPETNGKILLLSNDISELNAGVDPLRLRAVGSLDIWDVSDPEDPQPLARLQLPKREHIWTCVADCEYANGAGGSIVERDSRAPSPSLPGDLPWLDCPRGLLDRRAVGAEVAGSSPVVSWSAPTPRIDSQTHASVAQSGRALGS